MEKMLRLASAAQKKILARLGFKLVHIKKNKVTANKMAADPLDSLVLRQLGLSSSFECQIELCRQETGFGFGPNQWHPFVAALKEYRDSNLNKYEGSILQKFYHKWNPQNAAEVLAGFDQAPESFRNFPPYGHYLMPWRPDPSLDNLRARIVHWTSEDYLEHGQNQFNMEDDGFKSYGPVSRRLGEFEYHRLISIYERIKKEKYLREHGDIGVMMVRDNSNYVFLLKGGGVHRTAAMAALGYKTIPAQYKNLEYIVDTKDVNYWPQVKSQMWDADEATAYVRYLFRFDSQLWAERYIYS